MYFSDLSIARTKHLKRLMPKESLNFHYHITTENGNALAKRLGQTISNKRHYLLIYDPYEATIDWDAIMPFINSWSEVILNHMVSDSMRAIKIIKKAEARNKYEQTYLMGLENLIPYGSDKTAYEKRIEEIIKTLRWNNERAYYIAAFPFFNEKNAIVYNLIHCTNNIEGFKLYKQSAWQTFGGKSSTKNTHGVENQIMIDFKCNDMPKTHPDEFCYYIKDIAEYLQREFNGKTGVLLDTVWALLDVHPIFPSDGFKFQIKKELKQNFAANVSKSTISFADKSCPNEEG